LRKLGLQTIAKFTFLGDPAYSFTVSGIPAPENRAFLEKQASFSPYSVHARYCPSAAWRRRVLTMQTSPEK
ncbi:MAG: hypothetical protein JW818_22645, partial [Pirellulales bacterium]|nr:hypothetical protein [Pirellulales bacterium]